MIKRKQRLAKDSKLKKSEKSFEDSYSRLEQILEKLESDEVSLDETLKLYEEGLTLTKLCSDKLTKAELRIKEINKSLKGELEIKDYSK